MRYLVYTLIMTFGSIQLMAKSVHNPVDLAASRMIDLSSLNAQQSKDFVEGKMKDCVLVCNEGSDLFLNLAFEGEILELQTQGRPSSFKVLQRCYLKCAKERHILVSTDLEHWQPVLKFFTGQTRVSLDTAYGVSLVECNLNYGIDAMKVDLNGHSKRRNRK